MMIRKKIVIDVLLTMYGVFYYSSIQYPAKILRCQSLCRDVSLSTRDHISRAAAHSTHTRQLRRGRDRGTAWMGIRRMKP